MIELNEDNIEEVLTQLSENPGLLAKVSHEILDKVDFYIEATLWDSYVSDELNDEL